MENVEDAEIFDLKKLRLNWSIDKLQDKSLLPPEKKQQKNSSQLIHDLKDSLVQEFGVKNQIFTPLLENLKTKLLSEEKEDISGILNNIESLLDASIISQ